MSEKEELPSLEEPVRPCDYISKRGVKYWFSPEWIRGTSYTNTKFGRIKAVKECGTVNLYMAGKSGSLTYIQGSIQHEFKAWHEARKIDYFFLADDPEVLDEFILQAE